MGQGADYYWIGGTGNWSDTLHWSSEIGGLPSKSDNVFFNANSFTAENQALMVDAEAECFNIDWTGVTYMPAFGGIEDIHIYGLLKLSKKMDVTFEGNIYFDGDIGEHNISSAGNNLNSDIYFNGSGSWNISDSLNIGINNIYLNNGSLNTMGNPINCGSFYSTSTNSKTLYLISSQIKIQAFDGKWQVNNSLNLIKGSSVIEFVHNDFTSNNTFDGGNLSYCKVVFRNNGIILGSNTFDYIHFSANCDYELQANKTQNIYDEIFARGCSGIITLTASPGGIATIMHNNGDINISFVSLNSIKAASNTDYNLYAWHAIDNGNNSGCTISPDERDMFWINSSGNWSDTTHWSSSGNDEDTDCVPTTNDNVNFTDAPFDGSDTVTADIENIQCFNMKWVGNQSPVFINNTANAKLSVNGSFEFSESMQNMFGGTIFFGDSLGGKTIKSSNNKFNNDLIFNGNNGEWTVEDSLVVEGSINLKRGSLITADNFISCYTFHSDSAFNRSISLGNSYIKLSKNSPAYGWSVNNENLQFDAGNSTIEMEYTSSSLYNYGGDTISFHNILFSKTIGSARIYTISDTYARFHKVVFKSNGLIYASNSFDTLSFSPGNYYQLHYGHTQKINHEIVPSGNCNGPIVLESLKNGEQAYISKATDTLKIMNTAIRDIAGIGGAKFIAEQSVDLGNNSGWDTIQTASGGKLFWVQGSGDWSDDMHWSAMSGGVGGECIPTPYDTVIFDQNSFDETGQFVNIDLNNALVHNMDWSSVDIIPEFSGNITSANLRIYGSLSLHPDMNFSFPGYLYFEANSPGQTILTNNVKLHNVNNNVTFDGIGGEWDLLDSLLLGHALNTKNIINFNNGNLNTNGQFIKCFNFTSRYNSPRVLSLDTSLIFICNEWYMRGDNLLLTDNNSIIRLDSGHFSHHYGNNIHYNDIQLNSDNNYQKVIISNADSIFFKDVHYSNKGEMSGENAVVYGDKVRFQNDGFINKSNLSNENIFIIDSLIFNSTGSIFGNDTVTTFLQFDSIGNIAGNGSYAYSIFNNDGSITGNNHFDTLSFSPGYYYALGAEDTLTINDQLNMKGNNCEDITVSSTSSINAIIHKEIDSVYADFVQMSNISATGDAIFDAGYFSQNINNSNEGWVFHDSPDNYSLGMDTLVLEGDSILLCASNFNGNAGTTYEWKDCTTGLMVGTDSCYMVTKKGDYCLSVYYDEGPGCVKTDEIYVSCYLLLDIDSSLVSCNGLNDAWIEMTVEIGTEPLEYNWYKDGGLYAQTEDIYDLEAGNYVYFVKDSKSCFSGDTVKITEPFELAMDYLTTDACFAEETGTITVNVSGGTEPYNYSWSNDSTTFQQTGLTPGEYFISVTDDHACQPIEETITVSELPLLDFQLEGFDLVCYQDSSGSIFVVNIAGGTGNYTDFIWKKENQTYMLGQQDLLSVQAGEYSLTIVDDYGCSGTQSMLILEPDQMILDIEAISGNNSLGAIDLTVSGGNEPYEYYWSTDETTEDIDPLGGGTYYVDVTDGNGCKSTGSVFVDVHYRIYAPTAFSPNNDGVNDEFELLGLGTDLREFELTIFNRWGEEVFSSSDPENNWNGTLHNSGEVLPVEVYTWMAKITYSTGESIVDKGNVTLLK